MKKRVVSLILLAASALTVTLCAVLQAQSQKKFNAITIQQIWMLLKDQLR